MVEGLVELLPKTPALYPVSVLDYIRESPTKFLITESLTRMQVFHLGRTQFHYICQNHQRPREVHQLMGQIDKLGLVTQERVGID